MATSTSALVAVLLVLCAVHPCASVIDPASVKRVHVVQSNHLDVGFADYAPNIMDRYLSGEEGTLGPPFPRNQSVYYPSFISSAVNTCVVCIAAHRTPRRTRF